MAGRAKATLEQRLRAIPQPGIREIALRYLSTVAATLRPNTVELRTDSIITLTEYLAAHHPHVHSLIPLTRAHMEGFLAYNHGRPWRGRVARSQPVSPVVSKRTGAVEQTRKQLARDLIADVRAAGRTRGATLQSSATGPSPTARSSDKSPPGPADK
jgi:hypothetical protein